MNGHKIISFSIGIIILILNQFLKEYYSGLIYLTNTVISLFLIHFSLRGSKKKLILLIKDNFFSLRVRLIFIILMIIFSSILRLYKYKEYPGGINVDSAYNGIAILNLINDRTYRAYLPERYGRETFFLYLSIPFYYLSKDPFFRNSIPTIFFGILTVFVFLLLMREVFSIDFAIISSYLLMSSPFHLTYSRSGNVHNISPLLMLVLSLYFLVRVIKSGRMRYLILTGIASGIGLQSYKNFKIFFLFILTILIVETIQSNELTKKAKMIRLFLYVGVSFLVGLPIIIYAIKYPYSYLFRELSIMIQQKPSLNIYVKNLINFMSGFTLKAVDCGTYFSPKRAFLTGVKSVLFLIGLGCSLLFIREKPFNYIYILIFLHIMIAIVANPNASHITGMLIPIEILTALGILVVTSFIRLNKLKQYLVILILIITVIVDVYRYFLIDQQDASVQFHYNIVETEAGKFAKALSKDYKIYMSLSLATNDTVRFINYNESGYSEKRKHYKDAPAFRVFNPEIDIDEIRDLDTDIAIILKRGEINYEQEEKLFKALRNCKKEIHFYNKSKIPVKLIIYKIEKGG